VRPIYNRGDVRKHVRRSESCRTRHHVNIIVMRIEKRKFDETLGKLLKAKPQPRKGIKTTGKRGSKKAIIRLGVDANAKNDELRSWLDGKAHVYIDYANVRAKCDKKNWMLDVQKTWNLFKTLGNVATVKFYFGKLIGNRKSEGFHVLLRKIGYEVVTKPVKIMRLSIDVSGIPQDSPSVIKNFVEPCLLRKLTVEAVQMLNAQLREMNNSGVNHVEMMKCNFDVEIAADMLLDNEMSGVDTFCLWTGDSDFVGPILKLPRTEKTRNRLF